MQFSRERTARMAAIMMAVAFACVGGCQTADHRDSQNPTTPVPSEAVIESVPSGARVEFKGNSWGVTPLRRGYPPGYFKIGRSVFTTRLGEAVVVTLYKDGYSPKTVELTHGPFEWRSFNGQNRFIYFLLDHHYEIILEPLAQRRVIPGRVSEGESATFAASGTCFAVTPDGLIITAYHVISGAEKILIRFDGGDFVEAKIAQISPANDLALLKTDVGTRAYLPLAPQRSSRLGQKVFTIGYPASSILGAEPKYTEGTISAPSGPRGEAGMLQISVPLQPGNSGGPLINEQGQVVGIVSSTAAAEVFLTETGALPQNVNWAIRSEFAATLFSPPPRQKRSANRTTVIDATKEATCMVVAE